MNASLTPSAQLVELHDKLKLEISVPEKENVKE